MVLSLDQRVGDRAAQVSPCDEIALVSFQKLQTVDFSHHKLAKEGLTTKTHGRKISN